MSVPGKGDSFELERTNGAGAASLTHRVYAKLRQDIIDGTHAPGSKLKVQQLVERYGVGASPIREALSLLTSDQLTQRIDNRGFRVSHVSRSELLELVELRSLIEERALRRSIAEGGGTWEDGIVTTHFRLSRVQRDGPRPGEWEIWHKRFHMALISGANTPVALRLCDQLYDQNVRYRHIAGKVSYPERRIVAEHDAIAAAALERNAGLAVDLLLAHYRRTVDYLLQLLPEA